MKKDIPKFRGFIKGRGWVYGNGMYSDVKDKVPLEYVVSGPDEMVKVEPYTLTVYTGARDTHGTPIYTGDIITYKDDFNLHCTCAVISDKKYLVKGIRLKHIYGTLKFNRDENLYKLPKSGIEVIDSIWSTSDAATYYRDNYWPDARSKEPLFVNGFISKTKEQDIEDKIEDIEESISHIEQDFEKYQKIFDTFASFFDDNKK